MSILDEQNILSDASRSVRPFTRTQGMTPDALAISPPNDASVWNDACEHILAWRLNHNQFSPDDQPSIDILDTALDFAIDERDRGGPAPTIVVPSGDGRVAFEWHYRHHTMIIDFLARGRAKYTVFADGRVVDKGVLIRNPQTRKLELGG